MVVVDTESDTATSKKEWDYAVRAHQAFLEHFGLSADSLPLVQYDVAATPPFRWLTHSLRVG